MPVWTPEPPPPPPVALTDTTLVDLAYDYLPEYVRESDDGTLYDLLAAPCGQADATMAFIADPVATVDPGRTPWERVPWLAAISGVDIESVPLAERRAWLLDPANYYRGSLDAIRRRVGVTLTGARQVTVVCPYLGDPLAIYVRTLASETPDPDATVAAIRAEVPAWLVLTTEVGAVGMTYNALGAEYPTYDDMTATAKTYSELAAEV
jgi:hypothetical protein